MATLQRGDTREDGKVFFRYQRRAWNTYEIWLAPDAYARYLSKATAASAAGNKKTQRALKSNPDLVSHERARWRKWRNSDPLRRLACNMRSRISEVLRENKTRCSVKYLGCSLSTLKEHLEGQFKDGMNWDNYGFKGWHVDHIKPLAKVKTIDELIDRLHYTNLQPLWWKENLSKGSRR